MKPRTVDDQRQQKRFKRIGKASFISCIPLLGIGSVVVTLFHFLIQSHAPKVLTYRAPAGRPYADLFPLLTNLTDISFSTTEYILHSKFTVIFFGYFIVTLLIFLFSLLIPGIFEFEKDAKQSVVLSPSDGLFKIGLDVIFGKHGIYKNSIRGWLPLQALFVTNMIIFAMVTLVLSSVYLYDLAIRDGFIAEIFAKVATLSLTNTLNYISGFVVGAMSLYLATYLRIQSEYVSKWKYCADLLYKLRERDIKNQDQYHLLRTTLALDLVHLDLWAKRGFCSFFYSTLEHAIQDESNTTRQQDLNDLDDFALKTSRAEEILEAYISKLNANAGHADGKSADNDKQLLLFWQA